MADRGKTTHTLPGLVAGGRAWIVSRKPRAVAGVEALAGVARRRRAAAPSVACGRVGRVASYHLSVKTIKRTAGRSATAAAAYRSAGRIACEREGRIHDYTRKSGIEETFIVAPDDAPDWARDRAALWNAAEASETRRNSVTAREWELALPSEISAEERSRIARAFAGQLVERYGVAADVAIHAPHREGDQRNHHAHVLTTTRRLEPDGFAAKTRVLDVAKTGGVEIEAMREVWAGLQNEALERAGEVERVDHRSLEARREAALSRGDGLAAEELDRAPEVKLGPAANAIERREMREAAREGRDVRARHRARGGGPCRPPGAGGVRGDARAAGAGAGDVRARARGGAGPRQRRAGGAQGGGGKGPERRARAGRVPGAAGADRRAGRAGDGAGGVRRRARGRGEAARGPWAGAGGRGAGAGAAAEREGACVGAGAGMRGARVGLRARVWAVRLVNECRSGVPSRLNSPAIRVFQKLYRQTRQKHRQKTAPQLQFHASAYQHPLFLRFHTGELVHTEK